MANYDANKIRNIVFLGHQSSGKTSLVESLYFLTGGTNQKGEVEKKNTVSDYTPEEQKRGLLPSVQIELNIISDSPPRSPQFQAAL